MRFSEINNLAFATLKSSISPKFVPLDFFLSTSTRVTNSSIFYLIGWIFRLVLGVTWDPAMGNGVLLYDLMGKICRCSVLSLYWRVHLGQQQQRQAELCWPKIVAHVLSQAQPTNFSPSIFSPSIFIGLNYLRQDFLGGIGNCNVHGPRTTIDSIFRHTQNLVQLVDML